MDIHYGRKKKGIIIQVEAKVKEWLKTIDNAELVAAIEKDLILTGGSIASMLLGEQVNDYDFYFKTKETAFDVAVHYVNKFNAAHKEKVLPNVYRYTPEVKYASLENCKHEWEDRVVIEIKSAGIASETQSTYGYFETMQEGAAIEFVQSMKEAEESKERYRPVFLSENAITLSDKVQIITRFYGDPEQIHNNYDFAHAKCYYDWSQKKLVLPPEALECLLSRTLVYRGSLYPVASIFRAKKFIERGWRITAGQLLKIMWQISELDLRDPTVLREQLTGVDMAYMWQLIDALKGVEPEKMDSAYIAVIIDKIFD